LKFKLPNLAMTASRIQTSELTHKDISDDLGMKSGYGSPTSTEKPLNDVAQNFGAAMSPVISPVQEITKIQKGPGTRLAQ